MHVRRIVAATLSTLALATGAGLVATPAHASGGTRTVETLDFVNPNHLQGVCGFPVNLHVRGTFNVVSFTDGEGNLTKEIRNFRFRGTLSANGVTIEGISRGPEIWTFHPDGTASLQVHGVVNRRVPGQGTVTLSAGYTVVLVDGDDETVLVETTGQAEDAAELCAVFS
jgi:hypothetical protein